MTEDRPVLIIDNGGYTLKALYIPNPSNTASHPPRQAVVPNCVGAASFAGRGIVGEQLFKLPHFHGFMLRRPVDRGFVVDAALQSHIWEYLLQCFAIADESAVELVLTVPFAAPKLVVELLYYLVAQRFKFRAVTLVSATFLALVADASRDWLHGAGPDTPHGGEGMASGCGVVVDFGFSATTVVPYVDFLPMRDSAVRVDVGGKLLSNRLKELISFTQVNMTEDGWLVNHIMEKCCHVALHPQSSLRAAHRQKRRGRNISGSTRKGSGGDAVELRYYLPTVPPLMPLGCREEELHAILGGDGGTGVERHELQHIVFSHEAFLIPELLFHPVNVGIQQMGVVDAIVHGTRSRGTLRDAPTLHSALLRHIVAFGGTSGFPQLRERLSGELRMESTAAEGPAPSASLHLQPLVERLRMAPHSTVLNSTVSGYTTHDAELQPLYGALALFTCLSCQPQLQLLRSRSHVDLSPLRNKKQGVGRASAATVHKTQKAFQDAMQQHLP
ncbi:putative actin-like protein [Trypanosoma rangeli]|uniref:Putative actin-like protein n=1 Tax=Trypanosoma rangeli TaxID=5698 RepID=A0A3R7KCE3_TRYRA|nr:putative actin-like protein [Trypanosoma rangeli]RNF05297.1 putative actin-like protein [Trypanosoma rangeli]|eukprot:RNF05297.1 putative actin-like protein [Trypanosoma rangeli]